MSGWTSTLLPQLSEFGVPLALVQAIEGQLQLGQSCLPVQELWVGLQDEFGWTGWGPPLQCSPLPHQLMLAGGPSAETAGSALQYNGRRWQRAALKAPEPWSAACLIAWRAAEVRWTADHEHLWQLLATLVGQQLHAWQIRTRAAEAARNQAKLRAVLDTALDGIVALDDEGQIVQINAAAERMFGAAAAELLDRPAAGLFAPAQGGGSAVDLRQWVGRSGEAEGLRAGGRTFPLEAAVGEAMAEDGRFYVAVLRDLSALRRVDRLERELVTTVSHELRTPLTSIRGTLSLVLGGVAGPLSDRSQLLLQVALRNSERLSLLVDDLLDMERLVSGQLQLDIRLYDANDLARQCVEQHQGYAAQHAAEIELLPGPAGLLVAADAHRLSQILGNLLSNAIKFTGAGRQVQVEVCAERGGCLWKVRDQGPGVPADFVPRLFERFAQADASDARAKGGTGLGLSIAKALTDLHGGSIAHVAVASGGAEFRVWLPAAASAHGV